MIMSIALLVAFTIFCIRPSVPVVMDDDISRTKITSAAALATSDPEEVDIYSCDSADKTTSKFLSLTVTLLSVQTRPSAPDDPNPSVSELVGGELVFGSVTKRTATSSIAVLLVAARDELISIVKMRIVVMIVTSLRRTVFSPIFLLYLFLSRFE